MCAHRLRRTFACGCAFSFPMHPQARQVNTLVSACSSVIRHTKTSFGPWAAANYFFLRKAPENVIFYQMLKIIIAPPQTKKVFKRTPYDSNNLSWKYLSLNGSPMSPEPVATEK